MTPISRRPPATESATGLSTSSRRRSRTIGRTVPASSDSSSSSMWQKRASLLDRCDHDRERLAPAVLALAQALHGGLVGGVARHMEAAEALDRQDAAIAQERGRSRDERVRPAALSLTVSVRPRDDSTSATMRDRLGGRLLPLGQSSAGPSASPDALHRAASPACGTRDGAASLPAGRRSSRAAGRRRSMRRAGRGSVGPTGRSYSAAHSAHIGKSRIVVIGRS